MKADLQSLKTQLRDNEKVQLTFNCLINLGYISRSGILVATTERLLFIADHMIGKGLKWEFDYHQILNLTVTNGVIVEQSPVPFIKKVAINYNDDFITFEKFSDSSKVDDLLKVINSHYQSK